MPLIKLFLHICLFQKGPQDVPASPLLLGIVLVAYGMVNLLLLGLEGEWSTAMLQILVEVGILLGFVHVTLLLAGLTPRFLQTAVAMVGSDALISSFALPFLILMLSLPEAAKGAYLFLLLLMLWHVGVVSHILCKALSRSFGLGVGLAIVYVVGSYQLLVSLFGPEG